MFEGFRKASAPGYRRSPLRGYKKPDQIMSSFTAVRLNAVTYPVEPEERSQLEAIGAEFRAIEGQHPEEIIAAAQDCDALLVVSAKIPHAVIERLERCRVIARLGAGTDRI